MDISIDSRTIQSGQYFVPVKGERFDGRDFIDEVISKGGIVLDQPLDLLAKTYRKKLKATVIGITGSAGKTTAKELLNCVLSQRFCVHKTQANQNNEIGVSLTILGATFQTEILLVECGLRRPGDMAYLSQILRPDMVVITNIGVSHLAFFDSQRDLATEKAALLRSKLTWQISERACFLNSRTPFYSVLTKRAARTGFSVFPFQGESKLEELFNLCYVVGRRFDLTDHDIKTGLMKYQALSQRLKRYDLGFLTLIDDSYNANPDAMACAFEQVASYSGRKIFVLGEMLELGCESHRFHQEVIELALSYAPAAIFTIGDGFSSFTDSGQCIYHFETQERLWDLLVRELKQEDVVLVKGSRALGLEAMVKRIEDYVATM